MKSRAKVFTLPTDHAKVADAILSGEHEIVIAPEPEGSLIVLGNHHLATKLIASGQKIVLKKVTNHPNGHISWLTAEAFPLEIIPFVSRTVLEC